jgi:hypothetical protein
LGVLNRSLGGPDPPQVTKGFFRLGPAVRLVAKAISTAALQSPVRFWICESINAAAGSVNGKGQTSSSIDARNSRGASGTLPRIDWLPMTKNP